MADDQGRLITQFVLANEMFSQLSFQPLDALSILNTWDLNDLNSV